MAQKFIDRGSFPNDPNADPIRSAFQKVNENFTELYSTFFSSGVTEITVAGGLTQTSTTGNIYIQGNFPRITVQTGDNLTVGIGSYSIEKEQFITSFSQPFFIDLAPNITTQNANFTVNARTSNLQVANFVTSSLIPNATTSQLGNAANRWGNLFISTNIQIGTQNISSNASGVIIPNLFIGSNVTTGNANITSTLRAGNANIGGLTTLSNLTVANFVVGNIIPSQNEIFDLGSANNKFRDLYLSGNTLRLGESTISANGSGIVIPSLTVNSNLSVGTVTSTFLGGRLTTPSQPLITQLGTLSELVVQGGLQTGEMTVQGNLDVAANLAVTGSLQVPQLIVQNITYPPNVEVSLSAPGSNTQITFNDDGNLSAVPGMTFNKTTSLLSISGNVAGGNLISSGGLNVTGNGSIGGTFAATGNVTGGNLITLGILSAQSGITSNGNITTSGFMQVTGNASVGNITTQRLDGTIVSVSGNVSGANLIASGILRVDGNANVGNLTTNGLVSAATIEASGNVSASNLSVSGSLSVAELSGNNLSSTGNLSVAGNSSLGNTTTNSLSASGNVSGANLSTNGGLSVTGNASIGNVSTAGISATGNVSGANLSSSGGLSVTGNASVGNLDTAIISASGNVSGGNLSTGGALSVTGNASLGNITSVGLVSATGNVSGANLSSSGGLSVTGNAEVGNVSTASIVMNGNLTGAALMSSNLLNVTGNMTGGNVITNGFLSVAGTATIGNVIANNSLSIQNTASIGSSVTVGANLAITGLNADGSNVTLTYTTQTSIPFPVGVNIIVSGCSPDTFNGTYTVATANLSQVTYSASQTGSPGTLGRVRTGGTGLNLISGASFGGNVQISGALINAASSTANFGPVNSSILSVVGTANAGNLNTGGNLLVQGTTNLATLNANGVISTSSSLSVGTTATIASGLNVGANLAIATISGNGTVVTLTFTSQTSTPFPAGTPILVSGVSPTQYNGTFSVTTGNASQITYSSTATGSATVTNARVVTGGTAVNVRGNASITNLDVASFAGTNASIGNISSVSSLAFASGATLSMSSGTATIGNISSTTGTVSGNLSAGNLSTSGDLTVSSNVAANRITVFSSVASAQVVNGNIAVGSIINLTGISGTGSVVTATYSEQAVAPFAVGTSVTIAGVNPAGYNGTFTVSTSNVTQTTFSSTAVGAYVSSGTIRSSGTGLTLVGAANVSTLNANAISTDGTVTAASLSLGTGNASLGNLTTTGGLTVRAINTQGSNISMGAGAISGNLFSANFFNGDGSSISNINAGNVNNRIVATSLLVGSGTATVGFAARTFAPFTVGQVVTVADITPTALRGSQTIAFCNVDTLTFSTTATSNAGFVPGTGTISGGFKSETSVTSTTVVSPVQSNITSVGTLANLSLSGTGFISGANSVSATYLLSSVASVVAAGTVQGTATGLASQINVVTSATAGTSDGVRLPSAAAGMQIIVINNTGVTVKVYPASSGTIDALGANISFPLGAGARLLIVATSISQWFTMVGVYG